MLCRALFVALAFAPVAAGARFPVDPCGGDRSSASPRGVAVGEIAPPIGAMPWLQLEKALGAAPPEIDKLRGRVVVLTTFGTYCDSCIRIGIPLANEIRRSNAVEDLCVVSIAAQIAADTDDSTLRDAKKLGIEHSFAIGAAMGGSSPYLDMNTSPNLTYAFVISRTGGVAWKGDPSRDADEYLAAVARALASAPAEPLPASLRPELATATKAYVLGDYEGADKEAHKVAAHVEKRSDADSQAVKADAEKLIGLVETTRSKLVAFLTDAADAKDAERFERARAWVAAAFPKGSVAQRAAEIAKGALSVPDFARACDAWSSWLELERARPPTFPASADHGGAKFAKQLARYVEKAKDGPGVDRSRAWASAFEPAPKR